MQGLFPENQKPEEKTTSIWTYALGLAGLVAVCAIAYYFWPL